MKHGSRCTAPTIASLEPPVAIAAALAGRHHDVDLVDSVLQACGGDHRLALREMLAGADFLRDQLYTASMVINSGLARGWKPKYERV